VTSCLSEIFPANHQWIGIMGTHQTELTSISKRISYSSVYASTS
jgi:hypothetical protein